MQQLTGGLVVEHDIIKSRQKAVIRMSMKANKNACRRHIKPWFDLTQRIAARRCILVRTPPKPSDGPRRKVTPSCRNYPTTQRNSNASAATLGARMISSCGLIHEPYIAAALGFLHAAPRIDPQHRSGRWPHGLSDPNNRRSKFL
jgi:hypothetical protein